ncbi:hypothetical protein QW71_01395 [Paenibacillus sp. IHB B 3415]|nr:hypothetical protein QW71_01395 [Paenibacillus sp. IHB B 3415]
MRVEEVLRAPGLGVFYLLRRYSLSASPERLLMRLACSVRHHAAKLSLLRKEAWPREMKIRPGEWGVVSRPGSINLRRVAGVQGGNEMIGEYLRKRFYKFMVPNVIRLNFKFHKIRSNQSIQIRKH